MTTNAERANELYYQLRPAAIAAYNAYFLARTPAYIQPEMDALLAPNAPKLMISEGEIIPVKDAADPPVAVPGSPGTARGDGQGNGYIELVQP